MHEPHQSLRVEPQCEVCPLTRVKAGAEVRIRQLCASPEVQRRLREIGVREDQIIQLLFSQAGYICRVCDARLAISEKLARLIMVEPILAPAVSVNLKTAVEGRSSAFGEG